MQKPIKIIFDASPLLVNKTGVAYYIERLITQISQQYPNEVELVGFYYNFLGKRSIKHFPKAPNIRYRPVRFIPSKVIYQLRRFGIEFPVELFSKERGDFLLFGNFLGYPSLFHTAAAPVVHDLTYLDLPEYVSAKNRSDLKRFVPTQIKRSRFVITVSGFSKNKIAPTYGVDPHNILVTPIPPTKPEIYSQAQLDNALQKLSISKPFMLFVGTIEPRKNLVNLIDAYATLPRKIQGKYSLVIAGRIGWNCEAEKQRLEQAKKEGLDIIYLGYTDDQTKATLFQTATLFVTASSYEGFGMPVLEAMSYGKPCAVSDIPVFHEVAGGAAIYFDQTSPQQIAGSLQEILENEARISGLAAASKARAALYDWSRVADSVIAKIKQSLGK